MSKIKRILNILFEKEEPKKTVNKLKPKYTTKQMKNTPTYGSKSIKKSKENISNEKYLTVTELSKHFKVTPAQLNNIFQELKWLKREERWIILTDMGEYHGAKQCYDARNKVKYLRWKESIKNDMQVIKAIEKFKTIKPKSKKEKGEEYEAYIAKHYKSQGYVIWEHGKEKGRLDQGIDLIVKKNKEIIFIQCKNWNENTRFKIDHVRVKASRAEARQFMIDNPLFKGYKNKFRYTLSSNCIAPSAIKYIEETNGLFDYEIIEMRSTNQ